MAKLTLHIHSNYSDGFYSVERILREADKRDFTHIAITDHNEIRGALKAWHEAEKYKVKVIPGIELFFLYRKKITELLVYFKKPSEIMGFYNEFIGNKLLPAVHSPQELMVLVKKYDGFIIQPHPKALKGCIRNGFKVENNLEVKNPMVRKRIFKNAVRKFGGSDLHFYLDSLNCYTIIDNLNDISDLWSNKKLKYLAVNNFSVSRPKRLLQALVNTFLIAKFLSAQAFSRKILRRGIVV